MFPQGNWPRGQPSVTALLAIMDAAGGKSAEGRREGKVIKVQKGQPPVKSSLNHRSALCFHQGKVDD